MKNYKKRVVDNLLARKLRGMGAVLVQGAKWCGKTTTCEEFAKSALYMADPDTKEANVKMADIDIKSLLKGATPRLIDEWQIAPKFWDAVRYHVDHAEGFGHFILTGSAVPPDTKEISHSGTGRIARLTMRPMSLWESGESNGALSMGELLGGMEFTSAEALDHRLEDMAFMICRGGWPQAVLQARDDALDRAFDYYEAVVESDASRVDGVSREPSRVQRLMRSYARLQGTQSNLSVIRRDMMANDRATLNEDTVASYLEALRKIFVVEDMDAWCPNLRSKAQIRTASTRYFTDPSIAVAALGIGPGGLMGDLNTFGYLFEGLAVRDLRIYAAANMGNVSHYRDADGLECDAVVHLRDGTSGLVEIKLGGDRLVEEGAATLNRLVAKLDPVKTATPRFKMVLTGIGKFAYRRREDDVIVCPISCLRP
ncbi:MAG: ATP-binding protein [Kiritimatiellae bacterium]|nr:ATP-binding protein [Kiritimatiellia bacterium]